MTKKTLNESLVAIKTKRTKSEPVIGCGKRITASIKDIALTDLGEIKSILKLIKNIKNKAFSNPCIRLLSICLLVIVCIALGVLSMMAVFILLIMGFVNFFSELFTGKPTLGWDYFIENLFFFIN